VRDEHKEEIDALRKDSDVTNKHMADLLETKEFLNKKSECLEKELQAHHETITKICSRKKELEESVS
jgi:chromosome segregation ATPase